MKNSIIEDIYYGRRENFESINPNEKYTEKQTEICRLYDILVSTLDEKEKEYLDNAYNLSSDMEEESNFEHFKEGLKIGLLLVAECLE